MDDITTVKIMEVRARMIEEKVAITTQIHAEAKDVRLIQALVVLYVKLVLVAAIALLISTFSTSTLFTTIVSFLIYFIGHFQADARDVWLHAGQAGEGTLARIGSLLLALVMPDFQLFNVIDAVIQGEAMPLLALGKLTLVGAYYALFFTFASWFIFADKEF